MKLIVVVAIIGLGACGTERPRDAAQDRGAVSSPEGLVRDYVGRDAHGERLRTAAWFLDVAVWPEEPAFDSYTVIGGYTVDQAVARGDTVSVVVTYHRLGWIESTQDSARLIISDSVERHEFLVMLTNLGWRIIAPRLDPHVLADTILRRASLMQRDRWALESLLMRSREPGM